jgi:hypothetical protein
LAQRRSARTADASSVGECLRRAEGAHLEDSITAHFKQGQMFGIFELGRRSNLGASRVLNEYGI